MNAPITSADEEPTMSPTRSQLASRLMFVAVAIAGVLLATRAMALLIRDPTLRIIAIQAAWVCPVLICCHVSLRRRGRSLALALWDMPGWAIFGALCWAGKNVGVASNGNPVDWSVFGNKGLMNFMLPWVLTGILLSVLTGRRLRELGGTDTTEPK